MCTVLEVGGLKGTVGEVERVGNAAGYSKGELTNAAPGAPETPSSGHQLLRTDAGSNSKLSHDRCSSASSSTAPGLLAAGACASAVVPWGCASTSANVAQDIKAQRTARRATAEG